MCPSSCTTGTSYPAEVVGGDSLSDVALLKIEAEGLAHVAVGDSDAIAVGEGCIAIGNPLGELTFTMTGGYVSALPREINISGKPISMFQTDAAINAGNSGGPLFDMDGQRHRHHEREDFRHGRLRRDASRAWALRIPVNDALRVDLRPAGVRLCARAGVPRRDGQGAGRRDGGHLWAARPGRWCRAWSRAAARTRPGSP